MRTILINLFLLVCTSIHAQKASISKGYFRNPLDLPMELSANFGELRTDHWHMGLDIRTAQKENQRILAAAEGYIGKVRIEPGGFGRSIWINHPNGLTTLYAHMNDFFPELEQYVTEQQYKKEQWAVELEIPSTLFPVHKGQFIGFSGNTGGSQGPHLHFEIRETVTGKCLNPLLFGFNIDDAVAPTISRLALYDRNVSVYEQSPKLYPVKKTESGYVLNKIPVLKSASDKVSFAIQTFDRLSGSSNPNGVYAARIFFDDIPQVEFVLDSISYADTRYMNAHIDYRYKKNGGAYFQHVSKLPGDMSNIYKEINSTGELLLKDTVPHNIKIEVDDAYGNTSTLHFVIVYAPNDAGNAGYNNGTEFNPGEINVFDTDGFMVNTDERCVYDAVHLAYVNTKSNSTAISPIHRFGDERVPVHSDITVSIKPSTNVDPSMREKVVIRRNSGGRSNVRKGSLNSGYYSAKFDEFGSFQAFIDNQPPEINNLGKGDTVDLSPASRIVFQPRDNFGIKSFRAELNGKWLRFTNDKYYSHIYVFDERVPYGVYHLKVEVVDLVGNVETKTWWFKRGPYTPPKKKAVKKGKKKKVTKKKPRK